MLLQCETEDGTGRARAAAWLPAGTLESLFELNEFALALLAEEAALRPQAPSPLLRQIAALRGVLGEMAVPRAAACPYLLVDAGFADPRRWRYERREVNDGYGAEAPGFFTAPGATALSRLVLTYAWHLARAEGAAARLLLGMPGSVAALIGRCTLRRIEHLAEEHPGWLTPRWPSRVAVWRELLLTAAAGESPALERVRLKGITLMAAEARLAALAGEGRPVLRAEPRHPPPLREVPLSG